MPAGFEIGMGDMIPLMGGHAWNFTNQPSNASEWEDPVWVMGPYDGSIVSFELTRLFLKIRAVCEYDSTLVNSFLDVVHALLLLRALLNIRYTMSPWFHIRSSLVTWKRPTKKI